MCRSAARIALAPSASERCSRPPPGPRSLPVGASTARDGTLRLPVGASTARDCTLRLPVGASTARDCTLRLPVGASAARGCTLRLPVGASTARDCNLRSRRGTGGRGRERCSLLQGFGSAQAASASKPRASKCARTASSCTFGSSLALTAARSAAASWSLQYQPTCLRAIRAPCTSP